MGSDCDTITSATTTTSSSRRISRAVCAGGTISVGVLWAYALSSDSGSGGCLSTNGTAIIASSACSGLSISIKVFQAIANSLVSVESSASGDRIVRAVGTSGIGIGSIGVGGACTRSSESGSCARLNSNLAAIRASSASGATRQGVFGVSVEVSQAVANSLGGSYIS